MPSYDHRLNHDLDRILDAVDVLGEQVWMGLKDAVHALFTDNHHLASITILADHQINRRAHKVNNLCHAFIVKHFPSAGHLRRISSIMRITHELERIGDYVVTIGREALHLTHVPTGTLRHDMEKMFEQSHSMLLKALTAFKHENIELARGTMVLADQTKRHMGRVLTSLSRSYNVSRRDGIRNLLDIHAVFYMLKRVGNRAENICEETLFSVLGEVGPDKIFEVLFLDHGHGHLSQMAGAIAHKGYSHMGRFYCAGRRGTRQPDPELVEQMARFGYDLGRENRRDWSSLLSDLDHMDVIVSLDGPAQGYDIDIPFHATFLEWSDPVGKLHSEAVQNRDARHYFEQLYRNISRKVHELMKRLRGEETM
ncbi:MAG: hypothetical protein HQL50_11915 [Magnetococcales bacterium]|nr:hypothetical protein [Magnetococcales bacterium]